MQSRSLTVHDLYLVEAQARANLPPPCARSATCPDSCLDRRSCFVTELARLALERGDAVDLDARAVLETHGRPLIEMFDGRVPLDIEPFRSHLVAIIRWSGANPGGVIGATVASLEEAISRGQAEKRAVAWGRGRG